MQLQRQYVHLWIQDWTTSFHLQDSQYFQGVMIITEHSEFANQSRCMVDHTKWFMWVCQLIYAWRSTLCYFLLILQVSNNGYISLNGYTGGYTPRPFPYRSIRPIIAPYWADIDTRSGSGRVYYGETTSSSLRSRAAGLVRRIYQVSFSPTHLFIATWYNVGYYNRHTNRVINSCWSLVTTCLVYWGQIGCMLMAPEWPLLYMWTQQYKILKTTIYYFTMHVHGPACNAYNGIMQDCTWWCGYIEDP